MYKKSDLHIAGQLYCYLFI